LIRDLEIAVGIIVPEQAIGGRSVRLERIPKSVEFSR